MISAKKKGGHAYSQSDNQIDTWLTSPELKNVIMKVIKWFFAWTTQGDLSIEVDDLYQEVTIRLFKFKHKFTWHQKDFLARASTVTRRICVDMYRKDKSPKSVLYKKNTRHSRDNGVSLFSFIPDHTDNKFTELQKKELNVVLRGAIDLLPNEQKEVVLLRHYGDMSFKEIAKVTRVSINTALWRMRYALISLRKNQKLMDYMNGIQ